MLWSERKRLIAIAEREAAGESLWTTEIDVAARRKIAHIWEILIEEAGYGQDTAFYRSLVFHFKAAGQGSCADKPEHFVRLTETDQVLDHVEAVRQAFIDARIDGVDLFDKIVNRTFNEHRVAFRLVEGEVVPLASDELHVEVVEPTLRLLVDSRFEKAHGAYLKALKEIQHDDPADAITDAGTALQETLTALGCQGNALGPLMKDARKRGLFGNHDQALIDGVAKMHDWASAERSTGGDSHHHSDAEVADAWLMVHIVGALIVRLADPGPTRSGQADTD